MAFFGTTLPISVLPPLLQGIDDFLHDHFRRGRCTPEVASFGKVVQRSNVYTQRMHSSRDQARQILKTVYDHGSGRQQMSGDN